MDLLVALDQALAARLAADDPVYGAMLGMLRYHLGWVDREFRPIQADSGKRLRGLLCLSACTAVGANWHLALPAAAALELVHNFSLIHDDIEDNGDERRGRAALWKVWGPAQGVNAGDAMFVLARLTLDDLGDHPRYAQIQRTFDQATYALTQGQFLDLSFETRTTIGEPEYMRMIAGKTAALIAASVKIGALVGSAAPDDLEKMAAFGQKLGLAFQITDDILGLWGDPKITGKSADGDILARKKSLPVVYALSQPEMGALRDLYGQPQLTLENVPRVRGLLDQAGARKYAESRASELYQDALRDLDRFPLEASKELRSLAHLVVNRVK